MISLVSYRWTSDRTVYLKSMCLLVRTDFSALLISAVCIISLCCINCDFVAINVNTPYICYICNKSITPDMHMRIPIIVNIIIPVILSFVIVRCLIFAILTYRKHGRKIAIIDSMMPETFSTFMKAFLTVAAMSIGGTMLMIAGIIFESCDFFSNEYFHSSKIASISIHRKLLFQHR